MQNVTGFEWDSGNTEKCQKHGVDIAEIEYVFHHTMSVFPDLAHSTGEERFIGIGKTQENRHVFVAFTLRHREAGVFIRPVSARYMHKKETEHYEKEITRTHNR